MLGVYSNENSARTNPAEAGISSIQDSVPATPHWSAIFSDASTLSDAVLTSDGRFIIAGGPYSENGFLAKIEQDGTILWQKSYSDTEFDTSRIYAIAELSDNNLVAVGEYNVYSGNENAFISKFNPNGDVIWQVEIGASLRQVARDVIPLDNGHFLIVGTDLGEISDGWIARFDANGNVVWQKRVGDSYVNALTGGLRTSDGNIVLIGSTWKTFSFPSADAWLLKIDQNGQILWQKSYDNSQADYFTDLVETADGNFAVSGVTNSGFMPSHPWALKFSPDGNLIWQREWPDDTVFGFQSVVEADNGRLIFVGVREENLISSAWLVALDNNTGTSIWEKLYGTSADPDLFTKIISAGDGDFLAVGETESFGVNFRHGWVLKIAEDGTIPGCNLVSPISFASIPTTATITPTTFIPQNTVYVPTTETTNVQIFNNPLENQCYYQVNFTDFSYSPAMFSPK